MHSDVDDVLEEYNCLRSAGFVNVTNLSCQFDSGTPEGLRSRFFHSKNEWRGYWTLYFANEWPVCLAFPFNGTVWIFGLGKQKLIWNVQDALYRTCPRGFDANLTKGEFVAFWKQRPGIRYLELPGLLERFADPMSDIGGSPLPVS